MLPLCSSLSSPFSNYYYTYYPQCNNKLRKGRKERNKTRRVYGRQCMALCIAPLWPGYTGLKIGVKSAETESRLKISARFQPGFSKLKLSADSGLFCFYSWPIIQNKNKLKTCWKNQFAETLLKTCWNFQSTFSFSGFYADFQPHVARPCTAFPNKKLSEICLLSRAT